jgi:hypothetical protein
VEGLGLRRHRGLAAVAVALLGLGCAGDLTVRAPAVEPAPAGGALSAIAPLTIEVPEARGEGASDKVVGERAQGFGTTRGPIALTETPGSVARRIVVAELSAAGHRVVRDAQEDPEVAATVWVREFTVDSPRQGSGWEVNVRVSIALRVAATPDAEDHTELVYTAERSAHHLVRPSLGTTERLLAECLADLGRVVAERGALARALEDHAQRGGRAPAS